MKPEATVRVALAGNPNSGKTSIFNGLTGAQQNVGNYPGVTVEKRSGHFTGDGTRIEVLDLPGTYSISAFSPEERIAQEELLTGKHDVVVVVVDSTALSRSLMLLTQVLQLGKRVVLCLNMADEARRSGQRIDLPQMSQLLNLPIIETVGHKREGVARLKQVITEVIEQPPVDNRLVLGKRLDTALGAINGALNGNRSVNGDQDWVATRLLVGDPAEVSRFQADSNGGAHAVAEAEKQRETIEKQTGEDISTFVTEQYFGFVKGLLKEVVKRPSRADARALSDAIDSVVAHRILGLPIFGALMYAIFWLTFSVGETPMGWIESLFGVTGEAVSSLWPAGSTSPLRSLLVDGVIGGVGGVLVFLPNILLLFLGLAILEDTGYLARAAFLMDNVMHRFGLHGKSFVPMLTGFGCSIPGIMATRTLENERDRLTTMLVLPLMSCGARLPIWMLLVPAFFAPSARAGVLWSIYAIGVFVALLLALALRRTFLKGEEAPFVMELPPYRLPTLRALALKMSERGWLYVRKAGTLILAISIGMWFLASYPKVDGYQVDAQIAAGKIVVATAEASTAKVPDGVETLTAAQVENLRLSEALRYSAAGRIGQFIEPVIRPLGFDWKLGTAMIGAFAAKEVFVAQLGVVYSMGAVDESTGTLQSALRRDYSPLVGFSLMLFLLISAPCMATFAVTRRESGSWRWALLQLGGLTAVAYVLALLTYQVGRLIV